MRLEPATGAAPAHTLRAEGSFGGGVSSLGASWLANVATFPLYRQGKPVRYLRSTFLPGEEKAFCLFDAPTAERVKEANELAEIPLQRIVEVNISPQMT